MELGFGVSLSQPLNKHQETPGALSALLQSDASSCGSTPEGSTSPEISIEEHPINMWVRLVESSQLPIHGGGLPEVLS